MSLINDALKRATAEFRQQGSVIQIPGDPKRGRVAQTVMAVSFLVLALTLVLQFRSETQTRAQIDQMLSAKIVTLEQKQDEILTLLNRNDKYLDTRIQLDVMELKADTKALQAKIGSLASPDLGTMKAENASLRDYLKTEIFFVNKRLHDNEREHSLLSERIDALKDRPVPGESTPSN